MRSSFLDFAHVLSRKPAPTFLDMRWRRAFPNRLRGWCSPIHHAMHPQGARDFGSVGGAQLGDSIQSDPAAQGIIDWRGRHGTNEARLLSGG
jgi:hypothetical protein